MTLIMPNQLRPGQYNDQITTVAMEITNDFQTIPEDIPFMVWIMVNISCSKTYGLTQMLLQW